MDLMATATAKAQSSTESSTAVELENVEVDTKGILHLGPREFRIRDLQSIELRKAFSQSVGVIEVYVGSTDHEHESIFSRFPVKRELVGVVHDEAAQKIRDAAADINVPVFER